MARADRILSIDGRLITLNKVSLRFGPAMEMDPSNIGYERNYRGYLEALGSDSVSSN